jgi:Ras GTPase-activating-like protein IQGAP2/3
VARENYHALKLALFKQSISITMAQTAARGHTLRKRLENDQRLLAENSTSITGLQALSRGAVLRQQVGSILSKLEETEPEVVQLQALSRAMMVRHHLGQLLSELDEQEDSVVELQSSMRGLIVRSRFAEKQRFFKENMEKVVKIQSIVRAKIQGQAYKSLTNGKNPPVGTLKGFVHLLNDSDFDFDEEVEFERLRKTVVQHVRQNEMADQYITQLDIKIALLVKNKITLDEVVKHQKHFGGHVGTLLPNTDISSKDPFDLKALNKTSRAKLEHYQELFFLLQTHPQYLSRLFRRLREHATAEKECERIKHLVMGLFGYAQKRREEYYLVKLIVRSLKEEIDSAPSFDEYLRTHCFFNKLFAASIKSSRDRKYMRDVLGALIKENFIDNRALDLESDPVQIYRSAIGNEELRTGKQSRRNPNVPREEAIRDPETRATFIHHMQDLRDICDQFFLCLEEALHRMPFAVRFIAQQTYEQLLARFGDQDPGHVLQLVGQWVWRNYLQPALIEPEKFGVVDRALTQEQKRNLGEVSKVLTQAVSGREFGGENVYLQPLNTYIRESVYRFGEIWNHGKFVRREYSPGS